MNWEIYDEPTLPSSCLPRRSPAPVCKSASLARAFRLPLALSCPSLHPLYVLDFALQRSGKITEKLRNHTTNTIFEFGTVQKRVNLVDIKTSAKWMFKIGFDRAENGPADPTNKIRQAWIKRNRISRRTPLAIRTRQQRHTKLVRRRV